MEKYLTGKDILLRKAKLSDIQAIFDNVWSDYRLAENMLWVADNDFSKAYDRMERTIRFQKERDGFFVALKENDEPIGLAGLHPLGEGIYEEGGICVAQKYQHRGYGKQILGILLDVAFMHYDAKQFQYCCFENNIASRALALAMGFHYDHKEEQVRQKDDKHIIVEYYLLDRDTYLKMRKGC